MIQRTINGSANQVDWTFDALGRVTSEENLLGEFTYTYHGVTNRLDTVTYPNGQTSAYTYLDDENDHRLQTIHHKYPNASTLSKFDYTYDAVGNILTWRQQADTTVVLWKYGYDQADQLTVAVKHATDTPQTVLKRFAYAYDPAGNRTVEQVDDAITLSAYDNLNRLTSQAPGGAMVIGGSLNEPGTVTISGVPAVVDANNNFRGTVPTTSGTNTFTIVAKDASGNTTTKTYEVALSGSSKTLTYDANGNLTGDGTRAFDWDAQNQLVGVTIAANRTEFVFDGLRRRSRLKSYVSEMLESDRVLVWCPAQICEERTSSGTVLSRPFSHGEQIQGTPYFSVADHLRSVSELSTADAQLESRFAYDPWGRRTIVSGTVSSMAAFAGMQSSTEIEGFLTYYRAYLPNYARWMSDDPVGLAGGSNLQTYVSNRPISLVDTFGLKESCASDAMSDFLLCVGVTTIVLMPVEQALIKSCLLTGPGFVACVLATHHAVAPFYTAYSVVTWTACAAISTKKYFDCINCEGTGQ